MLSNLCNQGKKTLKFKKIANIFRDLKQKQYTVDSVILWVARFLLLFCNQAFFDNIIQQYSLSSDTFSFIVSLAIFLFALTVILLGLVSSRYTLKPVLVIVFFRCRRVQLFHEQL